MIIRYKGQLGEIIKDWDNTEIKRFLPCNYGKYYTSDLEQIDITKVEEASIEDKKEFIVKKYPWGEVINVHCIGEYQIVEAIDKTDKKQIFSCYMDFKRLSYSADTLDKAIIICIANKYDGINSQAAYYFIKMIGM